MAIFNSKLLNYQRVNQLFHDPYNPPHKKATRKTAPGVATRRSRRTSQGRQSCLGQRRRIKGSAYGATARPGDGNGDILDIPSGNLTVCYWKWPFIVDLPMKNGDVP